MTDENIVKNDEEIVKNEEITTEEIVKNDESVVKNEENTVIVENIVKNDEDVTEKATIKSKNKAKKSKLSIGQVVKIAEHVNITLDGFKLFPEYKKGTYIVDNIEKNIVILRRLNLKLRLYEADILIPGTEPKNYTF